MKSLNKKVVLITGSSSGFGKFLVPLFLKKGWIVIASFRNNDTRKDLFSDEKKTHSGFLEVLPLDVMLAKDREGAFNFIKARFGRLDCLINNAGYGAFGSLEDISELEFREQMEVNFFGATFLTRQLLPLLREVNGKIIFVSSSFGFTGFPLSSAYCSSKFAVEGLAESLYYELRPHKVQVSLIEPGGFRTRFSQNAKWGFLSHDPQSPYHFQTENYKLFKQSLASGKGSDPEVVAKIIVSVAEQRKTKLRYRAGLDSQSVYFLRKMLPEKVFRSLWAGICENIFMRKPKLKIGSHE